MTKTFECPRCGAPLDYNGAETTIRCPYCNNSVIVPEELLTGHEPAQASAASMGQAKTGAGSDTIERINEVKSLIEAGKKIEAIKRYREITDVGLVEAKKAVEDLEAGIPVEVSSVSSANLPVGSAPDKSNALGKVAVLVQAGKKIEAIKLYRETFDVGLVEAKTAIEKIQAGKFDDVAQMALGSNYIPQVTAPGSGLKISKTALAGGAAGGTACLVLIISFVILIIVVPILAALASGGGPLAGVWTQVNPFAFARLNLSFGGEGTGPGRFTDARNIAVDNHSGNIYVTELKGGRVQVFDQTGKFLAQWNVGDSKTYIASLAADRSGNLYLVIAGDLYCYEGTSGKLLKKVQYKQDEYGFKYIANAVDGGLVASWNEISDDLVRFNNDGSVAWVAKAAISSVSDVSELETHLAIDGTGNVYALGMFNNAVFQFSPAGKYLNRWGSKGFKKGQLYFPDSIAVDNRSRVYVADGKGIQVFDADGHYLSLIPVQGAAFSIAITDKNELWVVTNKQIIRKYVIVK